MFVLAQSLRVPHNGVEAWPWEPEGAGHVVPTGRKQRTRLSIIRSFPLCIQSRTMLPWFAFCYRDKTVSKTNLERNGFARLTGHSPSLREAKMGLKAGTWIREDGVYGLTPHGLLNLLS